MLTEALPRLMHPGRLELLRPWLDPDHSGRTVKLSQASDAVGRNGSIGQALNEWGPQKGGAATRAGEHVFATALSAGVDVGDALERVLVRAHKLGIVVEHTGNGLTRMTWVRLDEARDNKSRGLVRRLLSIGFARSLGEGYWK